MKARKEMREAVRRQKRIARAEAEAGTTLTLGPDARSTWREAIKSQGTIPLNDIPRTTRRRGASSKSPPNDTRAQPEAPVTPAETSVQPPPSGPGPPDHSLNESSPIDALADDLATMSTDSPETSEDSPTKPATPQHGDDPTFVAPVLSRFDSDETETGASPPQT
jgi:hypothetical protein